MPETNGKHATNGHDPSTPVSRLQGLDPTAQEVFNALSELPGFKDLVHNVTSLRSDFLRTLYDPRRSLDDECGWPASETGSGFGSINPDLYRSLYERHPIAARVVQLLPKECWQQTPTIYEDDDPNVSTPFEEAWDEVSRNLTPSASFHKEEAGGKVWSYLKRADVLSGIGHFGVMLLGVDDGRRLDQPVEGVVSYDPPTGNCKVVVDGEPLYSEIPRAYPVPHTETDVHEVRSAVRWRSDDAPPTDNTFLARFKGLPTKEERVEFTDDPLVNLRRNDVLVYNQAREWAVRNTKSPFPPLERRDPRLPTPNPRSPNVDGPPRFDPTAVGSEAQVQDRGFGMAGRGKEPSTSPARKVDGTPVFADSYRSTDVPPFSSSGTPKAGDPDDPNRPNGQPAPGFYDARNPLQQSDAAHIGTDAQYVGVQLGPTEYPDYEPSKKQRKLLFVRVFDESLVQIVQYEANVLNPRFGQPVMYRITLNDPREMHSGIGLPLATVRVHWSRVVHLKDSYSSESSSEIFGVPRMRPVLNHLLDLRKVYGASAEGYYKSCFTGLSFETHPQLGGDPVVSLGDIRKAAENFQNSLQKVLYGLGGAWKTLAPQVVDPTPFVEIMLEAICIQLGCPVRVFKGSERGELASSQDDASWNDRLRSRQDSYVTPELIVPFVDRLISIGVLPEPSWKPPAEDPAAELGQADKPEIGTDPNKSARANLPEVEGTPRVPVGGAGAKPQQPMGPKGPGGGGGGGGGPPGMGGHGPMVPSPGQLGTGAPGFKQDFPPKPSNNSFTGNSHEDQARDELGRFAAEAGANADASGKKEDHVAARLAHSKAADAYRKAGDESKAVHHTNEMFRHREASGREDNAPGGGGRSRVNWRGGGKGTRNARLTRRATLYVLNAGTQEFEPKQVDLEPGDPGFDKAKGPTVHHTATGYKVEWPDLDSLTDKDKADVANTLTMALSSYSQLNPDAKLDFKDFLVHFMDMDEELADSIIMNGKVAQAHQEADAQALADEHGFAPAPPPGFQDPEQVKADRDVAMAAAKNPAGAPGHGGQVGGQSTQTHTHTDLSGVKALPQPAMPGQGGPPGAQPGFTKGGQQMPAKGGGAPPASQAKGNSGKGAGTVGPAGPLKPPKAPRVGG